MNNESKSKPLILAITEAEKELINLVNKFLSVDHIPCYFLDPMFDKIGSQLKAGANAELYQAKNAYYTPEPEDEPTAQSSTEDGGADDAEP